MLPAFGKTRSDDALMLAFTLLNRRFDYHGFTVLLCLHRAAQQHPHLQLHKKPGSDRTHLAVLVRGYGRGVIANVRFWRKADIGGPAPNVRF